MSEFMKEIVYISKFDRRPYLYILYLLYLTLPNADGLLINLLPDAKALLEQLEASMENGLFLVSYKKYRKYFGNPLSDEKVKALVEACKSRGKKMIKLSEVFGGEEPSYEEFLESGGVHPAVTVFTVDMRIGYDIDALERVRRKRNC